MVAEALLGIDIGTTAAKAILCDRNGALLAQASEEYPTAFPQPGWAEQDPEAWWQATCHVVRRVLGAARLPAQAVAGVCVSCQAPTLAAVDAAGRPLYPALIWMDRRAEPQCAQLRAEVEEALVATLNGGRIDPYYLAPKLRWLRKYEPDIYARCHQVLQANGYIVHKLTGVFCMDSSHGPLTLCFDSARGEWSPRLIEAMRLDPEKLPPIRACGEVIGMVTPKAAEATGLAPGTPVIAGMTDGTAAAVEVGLTRPGDAAEMTGQSTVLLICSDAPYRGTALIPLGHAIPGLHLVVGAMSATGGALRWFRDQLGEHEVAEAQRQGVDPFELLSAKAAQSPPGANRLIFLPYMYGERSPIWDSAARGVFFGLSLATTKGDLVRAILEGAAYGLRHNVETAAEAGFMVETLACVGGGARSALWNQIKADVLGRPVTLPQAASGAAMGDAILVAASVGLYTSLSEAVAAMVRSGPTFLPQAENRARYNALYHIYRQLYPTLRPLFHELAETYL
ncbi:MULTISPECIES: xylulokinase [Caldilinea]|jgi:xylulokinase|uniref:Xylulose kinase n=1 Tax=Caldilinea aerophila (strain DSM 14535 / JCM 11387 / NBRC 104270 / STL-6-O1) TaxID=926550 RepID=I0I5I1_CALAS|nr:MULTISPECIES: FGGY-family carbohydrate kinase [Caldilinea]BAM00519.1 xylulose kinase [Caldilinea aerophila DSM 14535 = NBRC 104270]GIV71870.1 MAG: xylulokinase [Caldilinea sp.]